MNYSEIEYRLDRFVEIIEKMHDIIKSIPIKLPKDIENKIINTILGDKDLNDLLDALKKRRPPRFLLIGRTGSGKSSLINALCGKYLAETSDVYVGTNCAKAYSYKLLDKIVFEVIDTRGIGESFVQDRTAEEELKNALIDFYPDAILFLFRAKSRDYINEDIDALKKITKALNRSDLPIIGLVSQVDELEPSREKEPNYFSERKIKNIDDAVVQLEKLFKENNVSYLHILPVSSLIEWDRDPNETPMGKWHEMEIQFDGRYNIDKLIDLLEKNIDLKAGIYLMLMTKIDSVTRKIAERLVKVFSSLSGVIGLSPIPFSDVYILSAVQVLLIMLIAYLSGKDLSYDTAYDFLIALGGAGAVGYGLRVLFQQGSKFANIVFPGAGSGLSSAIATAGTYAMGKTAISYFMDNVSNDDLKDQYKRHREKYENENKE